MNLKSTITPTWCPGCNNYLIFGALQAALSASQIDPANIVFCIDIGCVGNLADFVSTYTSHTLHGRSIPFAMGVKMANPKLTVIVIGGDGGIYGEGLNHLIAAARMNIDIKVIVANNHLYSLTTGQTSPTTPKGAKTKSTPLGNVNESIDATKIIPAVSTLAKVDQADSKNPLELIKKSKN
jgi:2-oxoglutarate ferredoxin oxidoreductase subunit beta